MAGARKGLWSDLAKVCGPQSTLEETLILHMKADKVRPWPVRQHRFHVERKWRFDLAWPELMLAVEVQGGVHTVRAQFEADIQKRAAALFAGWTVLEVGPREVRSGQAVEWVKRLLWERSGRFSAPA